LALPAPSVARCALSSLMPLVGCLVACRELMDMAITTKETGSALSHFKDLFNAIDVISLGIMLLNIYQWISIVYQAEAFDLDLRYAVYSSLTGTDETGGHVNWLELHDEIGTNMTQVGVTLSLASALHFLGKYGLALPSSQVGDIFHKINEYGASIYNYKFSAGLSIVLMLLRILKLMDFHPDIGMITRTLREAGTDLINFTILAFIIVAIYTFMGHLLFGAATDMFSLYSSALLTCFVMMIGDTAFAEEIPNLGNTYAQISGYVFFYSYMILVFLILLSALLAIVVAAMDAVKESNRNSGLPQRDVPSDVTDMLGYLVDWLYSMVHRPDNKTT
ncbi:hypothetical protein CYMTET_52545, partial [Cymbomonas tetramitiformis]